MISNKDRNNKGKVKSVAEEHMHPRPEPSSRELRRKAATKKIKRLKIKR